MFTDAHRFEYAMLWWQEGNLTLLMSPLSSHLSFWTSVLQLSVAGSCILAVSTSVIHHSIVRCSLGVLKGIPRLFFLACCGQRLPFHMLFCLRPVYGRTSQGMRERRRCPPCWLQGYTCIYCLGVNVSLCSTTAFMMMSQTTVEPCVDNTVFVSWQPQILDEVCLENTPAFYFFKDFSVS